MPPKPAKKVAGAAKCELCDKTVSATRRIISCPSGSGIDRDYWFFVTGPRSLKGIPIVVRTISELPPYILEICDPEVTTFMCRLCLTSREVEYVRRLPLEDLPLMINIRWLTLPGKTFYRERLEDGK